MKDGALFEASRLMEAAENRIVATQMNKSLQEPPWDGFCGLLKVCDDLDVDGLLATQLPNDAPTTTPVQAQQTTQQQQQDEQLLIQLEATLKALEQQPHTQRHALLLKVADTAYTAGVAKIQAGQPAQAQQLLQLAAAACPESKVNARRKIQQALNTCRGGGGGGGAA